MQRRHCSQLANSLFDLVAVLQSLAVADTSVLVYSLLLRSFRFVLWPITVYRYIFLVLYPTAYVLRLVQTWLVVLLTVDRHIAVCHPLHAQRLASVRRTTVFIVVLIVVSTLFSIPRYFEFELTDFTDDKPSGFTTTALLADKVYAVVYRITLFFLVMYLIPMAVLTVLNIRLLMALRESQAYQASSVVHFTSNNAHGHSRPGLSPRSAGDESLIVRKLSDDGASQRSCGKSSGSVDVGFYSYAQLRTLIRFVSLLTTKFIVFF